MAKIEKVCTVCSEPFSVWQSRADTAKVCSATCRGKLNASAYEDARVKITCPICGKIFPVNKAAAKLRECCSIVCANKMPDRLRPRGEAHYNWKGGQVGHASGYLYSSVEKHPFASHQKYILEHRLVMESRMRREAPNHHFLVSIDGTSYLKQDIEVHHINERKRDNREVNLLACTASAHRSIHNGGKAMQGETWPEREAEKFTPYKVVCICERCGAEFLKKRHDVARGSGKFCNRSCYEKSRQK